VPLNGQPDNLVATGPVPESCTTCAPVFVVGAARSGTTLLQQMLDHHPSLAFPWESHFIAVLHGLLDRYGDLREVANRRNLILAIERYQRLAFCEDMPGEWIPGLLLAADSLAEQAPPTYSGVIDAIYTFYARQRGRFRWGDKTPGYVNNLPLLLQLFPRAKFLHIVRDGRDAALSLMPLSFGPNTVFVTAQKWKHWVQHGLSFAEGHPEAIHMVRYEDLTDDPETVLRGICEFLGEDFCEEMLEYHRDAKGRIPQGIHGMISAPASRSRQNRWKTEMSQRQIRVFEAVAGPLLETLGYERSVPDAKLYPWEKRVGKALDRLLVLRPGTRPHGLWKRTRMGVERFKFMRNPFGD
jgi:hypothetical protein